MASVSFPKIRKHATGRAVVTVRLSTGERKDFYLGPWRSSTAEMEYARICRMLAENNGIYPGDDLTVAETLLKYLVHAEAYYGVETSGLQHVKRTLKTVREMYEHTPAKDFGPKCLKSVVDQWVIDGITRKSINKMLGTVKRAWRWMVGEELLPADCYHRLQAVEGLRMGRTKAPDNPPVRPAVMSDVDKALPLMPKPVAAVVRLQVLTGARCGELLGMKATDVERAEGVWVYVPKSHKGTWRGKARRIMFGPEAQAVLAPFLDAAGTGFVFSPAQAEAERNANRGETRKTPKWPSHMKRNKDKRAGKYRERPPGETYTTNTVRRAVERACDYAGVGRFTPHRLRHLAALNIREQFGIEHARAVLGHSIAAMTEHYSKEIDSKLAKEVAGKAG